MSEPANTKTRRLGRVWWIVFAVGFVGLVLLVSFFVRFKTFQIPSGSMIPTVLPGDHVFVRMWRFGPASPERGDLVVFRSPDHPESLIFNRVVGLPGDRVEIVGKRLRINGREVREPYVAHRDPRTYGSGEGPIAIRDNLAPEAVPADHFFMMGDNRDYSFDSRFYGTVPRANLLGGGEVMVYLSVDPETREVRWSRSGLRLH